MDCLFLLCYGDADAKLAVWNCKGSRELVNLTSRAMTSAQLRQQREDAEQLLWMCSRLLRGQLQYLMLIITLWYHDIGNL